MERALLLFYLSPADSSFLPKEQMLPLREQNAPPLEPKSSSAGNFTFLPWKFSFPREESFWKSCEVCPLPEKSTQLGRCYCDGTRIILLVL